MCPQVPNYVPVCAGKEWGFDDLLEKMWSYLDMKRIYTKPRGPRAALTRTQINPRREKHSARAAARRCKRHSRKQGDDPNTMGAKAQSLIADRERMPRRAALQPKAHPFHSHLCFSDHRQGA